jgi:hypothetical protein
MPLKKGKKAVGQNVKELMQKGMPHKQAVAAALHAAEKGKAKKAAKR